MKDPKPPSLAECCLDQVRTQRLGEQLPTLLALLPKEIQVNVLPHQPGPKWRTLAYYLSWPLWHD